MSKIQEFGAAVNANFQKIQQAIIDLDSKLQHFQNSPDEITPADQATLDDILATSAKLATAAQAGIVPAGTPGFGGVPANIAEPAAMDGLPTGGVSPANVPNPNSPNGLNPGISPTAPANTPGDGVTPPGTQGAVDTSPGTPANPNIGGNNIGNNSAVPNALTDGTGNAAIATGATGANDANAPTLPGLVGTGSVTPAGTGGGADGVVSGGTSPDGKRTTTRA